MGGCRAGEASPVASRKVDSLDAGATFDRDAGVAKTLEEAVDVRQAAMPNRSSPAPGSAGGPTSRSSPSGVNSPCPAPSSC